VFETFASTFRPLPADQTRHRPWLDARLAASYGYSQMAEEFAGRIFENGLYRFHDAVSGPVAEALVAGAFPDFASRACPFGFDWLGRQFAMDSTRIDGGEALVLMMEPGTGEALEVPLTFAAFHEELGALREPALAAGFFAEWSTANPTLVPVKLAECVGYRVPLFLGGSDDIDNLELIDLAVYWTVCGQLRLGTLQMPAGTSIRAVSIREGSEQE
jgi:type VI secretion system (T6SS) immunity protein Tdi1